MRDEPDQARGCATLIVFASLSAGAGGLFGWPIGCLLFAVLMGLAVFWSY